MAQPITIPNNTLVIPINLLSTIKTFTLPVVSSNPGRILIFKDIYGNAAISSLRLSTIGLDKIEASNLSSIALSNAYGAWWFTNDGVTRWLLTEAYLNNLYLNPIFSVTAIAGLQLWLDGSDSSSSSMALTGATITTWKDKSGNGNNTTAAGGTTTLLTNAINGLSVASFTNTYFTGPFATAFTGTQIQCFAVAMMNSSTGAYGRILSLAQPATNDFNTTTGQFSFTRNNGTLALMVGRNSSYLSTAIPAYLTPFLIQSGHNGATEFIGVNGTLTPSSQNTGVGTAFNITGFGVGTNTATGDTGGYWYGYIGEILYYTGLLTTAQRQQVEGYLAWKWGLQGSLPAGHPYKNGPP